MFELIYTSAPKGILPGRTGFSTVAFTAGMPPNLLTPLENLSGYEFSFRGNALPEECNPPVYSFVHLKYGTATLRVASRIAPNGLDYTMRNNKIAHHLLFENDAELDRFPSGVSGIFGVPGNFAEAFEGPPHELPVRHIGECATPAELPAGNWERFTGDAGWAGVIAGYFLHHPEQPFFVEYPLTVSPEELLMLLGEVTELLPPERRKDFTFSTYFTRERPGEDCFLRMIPEFSPLLGALKRFHPERILTLGEMRAIPEELAEDELVPAAREGRALPEPPVPPPEIQKPEPPLRLRYEEARAGRTMPPPDLSVHPHSAGVRITREVEPEKKAPHDWRPWIIAAIILLVLLLAGVFGCELWQTAQDVQVSAVRDNVKALQTELAPQAPPAEPEPVKPEPPVPQTAKPEPPQAAGSQAIPEKKVKIQPLPADAAAVIFTGLQMVKRDRKISEIVLPSILRTAQSVVVNPDKYSVILQNGRLRFPALSVNMDQRGREVDAIRKIEFHRPGEWTRVYDAPQTGHLTVDGGFVIRYTGGNILGTVKILLGSQELLPGTVIADFGTSAERYHKSVQNYAKAVKNYLDRSGDGAPYTEEGLRNSLKKLEKMPPEKVQKELKNIINGAAFGHWKKGCPGTVKMEEMIQDWLLNRFAVRQQSKNKAEEDNAPELDAAARMMMALQPEFEAARLREAAMTDKVAVNRARIEVNGRLGELKRVVDGIPTMEAALTRSFFAPLNVKDDGPPGRWLAKELEAPAELTDRMLNELGKMLESRISYEIR